LNFNIYHDKWIYPHYWGNSLFEIQKKAINTLIVIFCDKIDDFIRFFIEKDKRIMDEIFYEIKEIKNNVNLSSDINAEIILHFLAKVSDTLILFETKQRLTRSSESNNEDEVIQALEKVFQGVDPPLKLIKGKIREIFLSYSS
jgi:hypothetical protein